MRINFVSVTGWETMAMSMYMRCMRRIRSVMPPRG